MDHIEFLALRRQNQLLARRLELVEAVLERSGIIDAVVGGPQVDPSPDDLGRVGLGALGGLGGLFGGGIPPVADPAPDDVGRGAAVAGVNLAGILRRFRPGDPPPVDLGRLSRVQLEATLHNIAAERARLESLENLVREQINPGGG